MPVTNPNLLFSLSKEEEEKEERNRSGGYKKPSSSSCSFSRERYFSLSLFLSPGDERVRSQSAFLCVNFSCSSFSHNCLGFHIFSHNFGHEKKKKKRKECDARLKRERERAREKKGTRANAQEERRRERPREREEREGKKSLFLFFDTKTHFWKRKSSFCNPPRTYPDIREKQQKE